MLDAPWYVVAVEPQAEAKVHDRASDLKLEAYVPIGRRIAKRSRRARVIEMSDRPAMPGYVFVRDGEAPMRFCQFGRDMDAPDAVAHCLGFLSSGQGPEPVEPSVVETLKQRQADGEFDTHVKQGKYVAPRWVRAGVKAKIIRGPLKGACGAVWRLTRKGMVAIWLTAINGPMLTEVRLDDVARAR